MLELVLNWESPWVSDGGGGGASSRLSRHRFLEQLSVARAASVGNAPFENRATVGVFWLHRLVILLWMVVIAVIVAAVVVSTRCVNWHVIDLFPAYFILNAVFLYLFVTIFILIILILRVSPTCCFDAVFQLSWRRCCRQLVWVKSRPVLS